MAADNVIVFSPSYAARRRGRIADTVQGSRSTPYTLYAVTEDGSAYDLTGRTLTGRLRRVEDGTVAALTGSFAITDAAGGVFTWTPSAEDVGEADTFEISFIATAGAASDISYAMEWTVYDNPSVSTTLAATLVGVPEEDAAILAVLEALAAGSGGGETVETDGAGGFVLGSDGGASDVDDLTTTTGSATDYVRVATGGGLEYRTNAQTYADLFAVNDLRTARIVGGTSGDILRVDATNENIDFHTPSSARSWLELDSNYLPLSGGTLVGALISQVEGATQYSPVTHGTTISTTSAAGNGGSGFGAQYLFQAEDASGVITGRTATLKIGWASAAAGARRGFYEIGVHSDDAGATAIYRPGIRVEAGSGGDGYPEIEAYGPLLIDSPDVTSPLLTLDAPAGHTGDLISSSGDYGVWFQVATGGGPLIIGEKAGGSLGGTNALLIGYRAGKGLTGDGVTVIGHSAGTASANFTNSTLVGENVADGASGSSANVVAVGKSAIADNTESQAGAFFGFSAGKGADGRQMVAVGMYALRNSTSVNGIALGYEAGDGDVHNASIRIGRASHSTKTNQLATGSNANTSFVVDALTVFSGTSGGALEGTGWTTGVGAAGGLGIGRLAWTWGTSDHATRLGKLDLYVEDFNAERRALGIEADGTLTAVNIGSGASGTSYSLYVREDLDGIMDTALFNGSATTLARTRLVLFGSGGGSNRLEISQMGGSFASTGIYQAYGSVIAAFGSGGLRFATDAGADIQYFVGGLGTGNRVMTLTTGEQVLIGPSSAGTGKLEVTGDDTGEEVLRLESPSGLSVSALAYYSGTYTANVFTVGDSSGGQVVIGRNNTASSPYLNVRGQYPHIRFNDQYAIRHVSSSAMDLGLGYTYVGTADAYLRVDRGVSVANDSGKTQIAQLISKTSGSPATGRGGYVSLQADINLSAYTKQIGRMDWWWANATPGTETDREGALSLGVNYRSDTEDVGLEMVATSGGAVTRIGDVAGGNYTEIEADGTLVFNGDATVYDDQQISISNVKLPASSAPTWTAYKGSQVLAFAPSGTEVIYFTMQASHAYKLGSTLSAHLHSVPSSNNAGGVRWQLTYSMADVDGTFPAETTVAATQTIAASSLDDHLVFSLGDLASTFSGTSGMVLFSLSRLGGDAADTYADDIYLIEVDIHIEMDTIGSRDLFSK